MAIIKTLARSIPQPAIDKACFKNVLVDPISKTLQVTLVRGYAEGNEFVAKMASTHTISGADYDALMQEAGNAAVEIGAALEVAIWTKLVAMGVIAVA